MLSLKVEEGATGKEYGWVVETGKKEEMNSHLERPEKNAALPTA